MSFSVCEFSFPHPVLPRWYHPASPLPCVCSAPKSPLQQGIKSVFISPLRVQMGRGRCVCVCTSHEALALLASSRLPCRQSLSSRKEEQLPNSPCVLPGKPGSGDQSPGWKCGDFPPHRVTSQKTRTARDWGDRASFLRQFSFEYQKTACRAGAQEKAWTCHEAADKIFFPFNLNQPSFSWGRQSSGNVINGVCTGLGRLLPLRSPQSSGSEKT